MALAGLARRRPLACYFGLAYLLSGMALAVIGLPKMHGTASRPVMSLLMFPVMIAGIGLAGIALAAMTGGREGSAGAGRPVPPPGRAAVAGGAARSAGRDPGRARRPVAGALAPLYSRVLRVRDRRRGAAGFCEEIGWTGFAYPRMRARLGWLPAALLLGLLWGLWHLPVVDSLGAASPHGRWWPEFFAAFIAMLAAIRVLIAWTYTRTGSLRMAQLLHASSTGSW
jgi:uncharacterized protein